MKTLAVMLLAMVAAGAQDVPQPKPWLNTETKIELGLAGGAIAADAWTTRKYVGVRNPGARYWTVERDPLAKPFAGSDTKIAIMSTVNAAGLVGGNYLLRNHLWIRRALNVGVIVGEGWVAWHNSRLKTW